MGDRALDLSGIAKETLITPKRINQGLPDTSCATNARRLLLVCSLAAASTCACAVLHKYPLSRSPRSSWLRGKMRNHSLPASLKDLGQALGLHPVFEDVPRAPFNIVSLLESSAVESEKSGELVRAISGNSCHHLHLEVPKF